MRIVLSPVREMPMRRAVRDAAGNVLRTLVFSPNIPQDIKGDDLEACAFDIKGGVLVETTRPVGNVADQGEAMVAKIQAMADQIEELTEKLTAAEAEVIRLNGELSEATAPAPSKKRKAATSAA